MMSAQRQDGPTAASGNSRPMLRALIMVALIVVAFLLGRLFAYHDVTTRDATIQQLQTDAQRLETTITTQNADISALRSQLALTTAKLEAIVPAKDTYNIDPNQALVVADGHLTIGWVGLPSTDTININVNGTPQTVAVGDIIHIRPSPGTACEVRIQTFDITKARFTASCAAEKPQ